jgi:HD superfamily phosphohydrolases
MEHVSQIGLKNRYLGKPSGDHNRWNHVKGVYTVGLIWLHRLYCGNSIPDHLLSSPLPDYESARALVGYSLLLHDYGHLPFSHLLEEAIHSIHWVPAESGQNSLEYTVLRDRLKEDRLTADCLRKAIGNSLSMTASPTLKNDPLELILQLTHGWCGMPWLQAIVNGPIDADKIDYLRRDQTFIHAADFPVQTRLPLYVNNQFDEMPWLNEFLSEQFVNHAGLLCLQGRSALAAIDLWRERLVLYDRFYLSPLVRAADRITLEIVQQFLIRSVMSAAFARHVAADPRLIDKSGSDMSDLKDIGELLSGPNGTPPAGINIVEVKYRAVTKLLNRLSQIFGKTGDRDLECFTFMKDHVLAVESTNNKYRDLLVSAVNSLETLTGAKALRSLAESSIIGAPMQFGREHLDTVRDLTRSFQQQYFADVLIDVQAIPRVLSIPPPPRRTPRTKTPQFAQILVPKGPAEHWSSGSRDLEPLASEKVKSLEQPIGRMLLLCPQGVNRAKGRYVFDRLLAELRQRRILYEEVDVD